jgi:hypothetical protein
MCKWATGACRASLQGRMSTLGPGAAAGQCLLCGGQNQRLGRSQQSVRRAPFDPLPPVVGGRFRVLKMLVPAKPGYRQQYREGDEHAYRPRDDYRPVPKAPTWHQTCNVENPGEAIQYWKAKENRADNKDRHFHRVIQSLLVGSRSLTQGVQCRTSLLDPKPPRATGSFRVTLALLIFRQTSEPLVQLTK